MKKALSIIVVLVFLIGTAFLPPLIKSDGGTPYIDAVDIRVADSGALLTATEVESALPEIIGLIPDNITDLTISSTVNFNTNRITGLANAQVSSDAVNKTQLDSVGTIVGNYHSLDLIAGVDGDTIVLDTEETLLVLDGGVGDPATFYIDGSNIASGSKVFIKYGGFSSGATLDRDDDNDPGNFLATGTTSGSTTLVFTGTGTAMLLKSGATWYQMY